MKHRSSKHVDFKDYKVAAFFTIVTCVSVFANKPYSPCISNTKNHNCSCTTSPPSLPSSPSFCMKCCPVKNLSEFGATIHSVSASWSPPGLPPSCGMYSFYHVTCSNGSDVITQETLDVQETMFNCTSLLPEMCVNITVTTLCGSSESEPRSITACTPPPPTTSPLPPPCKYFCKMCPVIQWMLVSLLCSNTLGWISVALIYNFNKPTKTDPYIQNTPTDHQDITLTQRESQLSSRGSTQDEDTKISENQPSNSMSYENLSCDIPEGPTVDTVLI
ncbi:uncharacterized protein LOC121428952 isoform X1 [Lytechinus variegatus]|uniref:uncharacterized protein LOC121428952 isoform X1 n=1 Tax=Lytechinus variegatus TaxID=7654 RepID=UPI001BB138C1|nr:uncharacterized protein LOC121428952 isoform X1 [Lytechinus variegatus]